MNKTVATWNGQVIAESEHCISVEGNAYFPPSSLKQEFFKPSAHTSVCPWKGDCNYFDVVVGGKSNANAAWVYHNPKAAAAPIKDYVAFWKGVEVSGAETARPTAYTRVVNAVSQAGERSTSVACGLASKSLM